MEEKKIAILQSNYIPWKGYFDLVNMADEFVIYDTAQYTKNDWRNRNKIKSPSGVSWLSIPVNHSTSYRINEVKTVDSRWRKRHWLTLKQFYSKAEYFERYHDLFEKLYLNSTETYLSKINYDFICTINQILGISTKITRSSDYDIKGERTAKLVDICIQADATGYISGPSAKNYLNESIFERENIKVVWMNYSDYPEYNQLFPPFVHGVSIIDLIFNTGENAYKYLKSTKDIR